MILQKKKKKKIEVCGEFIVDLYPVTLTTTSTMCAVILFFEL